VSKTENMVTFEKHLFSGIRKAEKMDC